MLLRSSLRALNNFFISRVCPLNWSTLLLWVNYRLLHNGPIRRHAESGLELIRLIDHETSRISMFEWWSRSTTYSMFDGHTNRFFFLRWWIIFNFLILPTIRACKLFITLLRMRKELMHFFFCVSITRVNELVLILVLITTSWTLPYLFVAISLIATLFLIFRIVFLRSWNLLSSLLLDRIVLHPINRPIFANKHSFVNIGFVRFYAFFLSIVRHA